VTKLNLLILFGQAQPIIALLTYMVVGGARAKRLSLFHTGAGSALVWQSVLRERLLENGPFTTASAWLIFV